MEDPKGEPVLYVTCYGANDENRHDAQYAIHFDWRTDEARSVTNEVGVEVGYSWMLRNWDSLGSCRNVGATLEKIQFEGYPLICKQM